MELKGKNILFLGSSVTYGAESGGISFVEIMSEICGFTYIKEAVSGTTLADMSESSYVSRLKKIDIYAKIDLVVCQLSTNDAYQNVPLCETEKAIVFIINYVRWIFGCPVVFFTGTKFQSTVYKETIELLYKIKQEYDFFILDLWNDKEMLNVDKEKYKRFMKDGVHPTFEGYRDWWAPKFIDFLRKI